MAISTSSAYHSGGAAGRAGRTRAESCGWTASTMIHRRGAGHPGGSLSAAEIMAALFFHKLNIDPARPDWPERDRFILSKGHASAILYAALARRGFFPQADLPHWGDLACHLQGHPDRLKTPGVEMTSGLLGHGIAIGVGLALAARRLELSYRIYVLLGDGECQGGIVWEGAMAAAKFHTVQPDRHPGLQRRAAGRPRARHHAARAAGRTSGARSTGRCWRSTATTCARCSKRWTPPARSTAGRRSSSRTRPRAKGVSFMEDRSYWHGVAPNDAQLAQAMGELGRCS